MVPFLQPMTTITVNETTLKSFIYTEVTENYSALLQTEKTLWVFLFVFDFRTILIKVTKINLSMRETKVKC